MEVALRSSRGLTAFGAALRAGIALRVPTPNVSVVDLVIQTEKKTFAEEVRRLQPSHPDRSLV